MPENTDAVPKSNEPKHVYTREEVLQIISARSDAAKILENAARSYDKNHPVPKPTQISRRNFLTGSAITLGSLALGKFLTPTSKPDTPPIQL